MRSIDDTSNFDEFPDVKLEIRKYTPGRIKTYALRLSINSCKVGCKLIFSSIPASAPMPQDGEVIYKDWVFINYTFKRFEGLTQRGTPTKK